MHALTLGTSTQAAAQQSITLEERFQDIFLTAGYSTAFGAAFGTALLAWTANPTENLKYVAIGASLGFIGGTLLGTYVVLQPLAEIPPSVPGDPDGQATGLRYPATVSVDRQHPTGAGKFHLSGFPEKTSANTPKGPQLKLSPLVSWDRAPKVAGLTAQVTLARF